VRLAAVVTLVDAENVAAARPLSIAVDAQIAYADAILVTKANAANTEAAIAIAAELAPRALLRIGTTDEHAAWLEDVLAEPDLNRVGEVVPGVETGHVHDEHCRHVDSSHAHGIDSVWTPITSVVDLEELEDQLADLPGNYIRIKGIARAVDGRVGPEARRVVIHRVGLRVSSEPYEGPDVPREVLVALGPGVQEAAIARCVEASALHDRS
jgi:G3E family GTPase